MEIYVIIIIGGAMKLNKKRVAVLTSGGDAPGMNTAIRTIVATGEKKGVEVYGVYEGYKGLVEGNIKKLELNELNEKIAHGGTLLYSARYMEFEREEIRRSAIKNLEDLSIDTLIIIGGDGSFRGGLSLSEMGIQCICIPGTIDNDISSTEYSIGFDTALNTAVQSIDKLKETSNSHVRCNIIELMGRFCGDLSLASGIASGCDLVVTLESGLDKVKLIEDIKKLKNENKRCVTVVVAEKLINIHELSEEVERETGYKTNPVVLGHIQRGGAPTAFDRILATKMGVTAMQIATSTKFNRCIGIKNNIIKIYDIREALNIRKEKNILYDIYEELAI